MALRGFVLTRSPIRLPTDTWWARATIEGGTATLFAASGPARDVAPWGPELFPGAELMEYADAEADIYRCAAFADGNLEGTFFVGPVEARPQWEAAKTLFAAPSTITDRRLALSEQAPAGRNAGPLICACFGVGLETIRAVIKPGDATSPEAIGEMLRAGTNCGSCLPELRRIIAGKLLPETV